MPLSWRLSTRDDGETLLADGIGAPKPDSDIGRIVYAFRQWLRPGDAVGLQLSLELLSAQTS